MKGISYEESRTTSKQHKRKVLPCNRGDRGHRAAYGQTVAREGIPGSSLGKEGGSTCTGSARAGRGSCDWRHAESQRHEKSHQRSHGVYFVFPLADGLVEASVVFAQAAKEEKLDLIVNMSQKQSRPFAHSPATTKHWLTEQVFTWSGVSTVHLRVTFFAEWLLYIAHLIRQGRYVTPFDAESRFAPIPASDIARVIVGVLEHPEKHVGATYQLHGPVEYSHQEIAGVLSQTLNKRINFEHVTVPAFLKLLGMEGDKAKQAHFEAVRIDQQEGLLAGTDTTGTEIIGQPLMTLEEFILTNKRVLS